MRLLTILSAAALLLFGLSQGVWAQAASERVIIDPPRPRPQRPVGFVLEKMSLEAVIDGQKAACTLSYVLHNPGSSPLEVDFLAPLPAEGTVTGLGLFDGQKEMPGKVYDKDEARKIYRQIVSQLRDPALLEYTGRDTFRARVFPVPPGGRQTLTLNFDYLAPKSDGQVGFGFPLTGPMTVGQSPLLDVRVTVKNTPGLSGLYSPLQGAVIDRPKGADALVTFQGGGRAGLVDNFQLYFQTDSGPMGGLALSHKPDEKEDGYFLFLVEPPAAADIEVQAKNVVFVLDKSGSMNGPKFTQAKEALGFILDRLDDKDSFNLVDYNARVYAWQPELMDMSPENRKAARAYVDNLRSGGNTNISEALTRAFGLVSRPGDPSYVIFLTDGLPTEGETNEMKLAELARKLNPENAARLFAFGVGYDVNSRLLDRLSGQAGGSSVFVKPDENLEAKISSFFSRLTSPALVRPKLTSELPVNRLIPEEIFDIFQGQQMVVVGRYPRGGRAKLTLSGRQGDKEVKYEYQVDLAEGPRPDGRFIASLWAQRRIGELIDQIDLAGGKPAQELVDELVALSKKYGILTPYTSFLALENQSIARDEDLTPLVAENLSALDMTVGEQANRQRALKSEYIEMAAPQAPRAMSSSSISGWDGGGMASLDKQVARAQGQNLNLPVQWGGQTFFLKSGQWQAENLSEEDLKEPTVVEQLSDEYFELAEQLGPDELVWLKQSEPVIFKFKGKVYLVRPIAAVS